MGGHAGAFINVAGVGNTCSVSCGKKMIGDTISESMFYDKVKALGIDKRIVRPDVFMANIPKVSTQCMHNGTSHIVMENVKAKVGGNSRLLDFKIGAKTAGAFDVGKAKNVRHKLIDGVMSDSARRGFRLEGITKGREVLVKKHAGLLNALPIKDKFKLYKLDPKIIFDHFFEGNIDYGRKLYKKMRKFYETFIVDNLKLAMSSKRGKVALGFYGSSVLFIAGDSGVDFKLIDFAHAVVLNPTESPKNLKRYRKAVLGYSVGFKRLMDELELWLLLA